MNSNLQHEAEVMSKNHQRRRRWYTALVVMAAIVVFCTTYALILPAITMEKEAFCGLSEHIHTDECYDVNNELSCELEEHEHSDECYDENSFIQPAVTQETTDTEKVIETAKTPEISKSAETAETEDTAIPSVSTKNDNGAVAVQLSGEQSGESGNLTWVLSDDGKLTITGSGEMSAYTSTSLAPWMDYADSIVSVEIGEDITSIGAYAFYGCSTLESVTISTSVTTLGASVFENCTGLTNVTFEEGSSLAKIANSAFKSCSSLEEITLPESLTTIALYVFDSCTSLKEITIPAGVTEIKDFTFQKCENLSKVIFEEGSQLTVICKSLFSNCSSLAEITLPPNITKIDNNAFESCTSLNQITIPSTVTTLGSSSFSGCTSLTEITIPSGVTTINANTFDGCTNLKSVTFSDESVLTSIGNNAFMNCSSLEEITLPSSVTSIGVGAFAYCTSLTDIELPSTVTRLDSSAFLGCTLLEEITLPSGLTSMGTQVFKNCTALTKISIPEGVTSIGDYTFHGCSSLTEVTIPSTSKITSIGQYAFADCVLLEEVLIPSGVTSIGSYAFSYCRSLTEVTIPSKVKSIGSYAFQHCSSLKSVDFAEGSVLSTVNTYAFAYCSSLEEIVIPASVTFIGENAFNSCTNLKTVIFEEGSALSDLRSAVFAGCSSLTEIEIPFGVKKLYNYVFNGCKSLTKVVLPSELQSLGYQVFNNCILLNNVTIPSTVTSIGGATFQNCSSLTEINIPAGVTTISGSTFLSCSKLEKVTFEEGSLLTSIGGWAFRYCYSLKEITFPASLKSIDEYAFSLCTNLKTVTFEEGSVLTTIGTGAFESDYNITEINLPSTLTTLGTNVFRNCSALTEITIPAGVTSIPQYTFLNCSKLKTVTFEEGSVLEIIGGGVFKDCTSLESITLPSGVTSIGDNAFYQCSSLTEITIPAGVTCVQAYTFQNCKKLQKVIFEENSVLNSISPGAFQSCTSLTEIQLPSGLKTISTAAFQSCSSLPEITIPKSVTSLGANAFMSCGNLKTVVFEEGSPITVIYNGTFKSCSKLTEINLPKGLTSIVGQAFYGCSMLKEITIPSTVTSIGGEAFRSCQSLKTVYFEKNSQLKKVEYYAFNCGIGGDSAPLREVFRLSAAATITSDAFSGGEFVLEINNNCADITDENVNIYLKNFNISAMVVSDGAETVNASLLEYFATKKAAYLTFDPGAEFTLVGDFAVESSRYPTLAAGDYIAGEYGELYRIGDDGNAYFVYCPPELTSITIPEKVGDYDIVGVDSYSFTAATTLTDITFESPDSITTVSSFAFANAVNLERINGEDTDVDIKALFTNATFGSMVFYNTKIKTTDVLEPNNNKLEYGEKDSPYLMINTVNSSAESDAVLPADNANFNYTYYTGQTALTTIDISQPHAVGCSYNVYFWSLNDNVTLNYEPGVYELTASAKTDSASVSMTVERLNYTGLYRIQIPALQEGYTLSVSITSTAPSPATSGDNMLVWGELVAKDSEHATSVTEIPSDYQCLEWVTKRSNVTLSHKLAANGKLIGDGTGSDVYISGFNRTIQSTVKTVAPTSVGNDLITSIDYHNTISIPDEMYWNPEIVEALNAGNWVVRHPSASTTTGYIYAKINGEYVPIASITLNTKGYYPTVKNVSIVDGKLCVDWNYYNASARKLSSTGAVTGSEISTVSTSFQLSSGIAYLKDEALKSATDETKFTVTSEVTETVNYMHSGSSTSTSTVTSTYTVGAASLSLTKGRSGVSFMGSDQTYTITATNGGSLPYNDLRYITDTLPEYIYISAANLETMFFTDTYGENLTVEITGAELCTPLSGDKAETVTGVDGNEYNLSIGNTAMNNEYSGMERNDTQTGVNGHSDCKHNNTITLTRNGDNISISVNGNTPVTCSAGEISKVFEEKGFIVTDNATYKVTWYLPDEVVESNEKLTFYIRSTVMNSFMVISEDKHMVWYQNNNDVSYVVIHNNVAYAYDENYGSEDAELLASSTGENLGFPAANYASLYNRLSVNGLKVEEWDEDNPVNACINDILTYSSLVTYKSRTYEVLPLVTHVYGAQVVLAPVEGNEGKDWATDLEIHTTSAGTEYYVLNKEGTYNDVDMGTYIADRVEVKKTSSGLDALVYYYLTDNSMTGKYVSVKTIASPTYAGLSTSNSFDLTIESWLGDHEHHRLWVPLGIHITNVKFDKSIVTKEGDIPENDELEDSSFIHEKEEVTYRFSITPYGEPYERIYNKYDLYDELPLSVESYRWSKSNISDIRFVKEDGTPYDTITVDNNETEALFGEDDWSVTDTYPLVDESGTPTQSTATENQQYITWGDDFKIILYDEPVYMYVTLTFPSGNDWSDYCDANYTENITNKLYFVGDFDAVYHELAVTAEASLTKGVVETGHYSSTTSYADISENGRIYYANDDSYKRYVAYYIAVYNDGQSKLYLDQIEDILPEGFTYLGLASTYNSTGGVIDASGKVIQNCYYYNNLVKITPEDGSTVTYKKANFSGALLETNDGKEHVIFQISHPSPTDDTTIAYDENYNKCFLYPGEALVISFYCRTNTAADTLDSAENNVAMKYFNYNGMGVKIAENVEVTANDILGNSANKNDGESYLYDFSSAKALGFSDGNASTQWLGSNVTVKRGQIVPGITKSVEKVTDSNGLDKSSTDYAAFTDTITWKVTAYNDGSYPIMDYTISDVIQYPFRFTGSITMSFDFNGGGDIGTFNLLTFGSWSSDGKSVTVKTSETGTSYTLTLDGDWVTISHASVASAGAFTFDVRISLDSATNNYVLDLRMNNDKLSIPEGGSVTLEVPTNFISGSSMANKVYYNTCFVTPNTQTYSNELVTKGNNVTYNEMPSVRNSAQISVTYGNATTSYKKVEETDNANNSATSLQDKNYIIVDEDEKNITYTLTVNSSLVPLSSLIIIDNLPEVGDHGSFLDDDYRFSDFQINLADDPNFVIAIYYSDDTVKTLDDTQYTIQFTNKTSFGTDDWSGVGTDWYDYDTAVSQNIDIRSFRIIIEEETGELMKSGADITVKFDAVIDGDPSPEQFAWNSFGYHYVSYGSSFPQEAAPLKVGVGMPSVPRIQKLLKNDVGDSWTAEEDTTFRFIVYKGSAISGLSELTKESEIADKLADTEYTYIELNVENGMSESDKILIETQSYSYSSILGWSEGSEKFNWVDGQKYTVLELPTDKNYSYDNISGLSGNTYTFTYQNDKPTYITAENRRNLWELSILKTDENDEVLANAVFGLYSPNESDKLEDDEYSKLVEDNSLNTNPDTELTHGLKTYYLTSIVSTNDSGVILWNTLKEDDYLVLELQAPTDGYLIDDTVRKIEHADYFKTVTVQVVNKTLSYELPASGGYEPYVYVCGGLLTLLSTLLMFRKLKRRREEIFSQ